MIDLARSSFCAAVSGDDCADARTSFTMDLTLVLTALFRMRLMAFCRARLSADLWLATFGSCSFPNVVCQMFIGVDCLCSEQLNRRYELSEKI